MHGLCCKLLSATLCIVQCCEPLPLRRTLLLMFVIAAQLLLHSLSCVFALLSADCFVLSELSHDAG